MLRCLLCLCGPAGYAQRIDDWRPTAVLYNQQNLKLVDRRMTTRRCIRRLCDLVECASDPCRPHRRAARFHQLLQRPASLYEETMLCSADRPADFERCNRG